MNGFELWSKQRFDAGRAEEYKRILEKITKNLIQQSKREGKTLTETAALKQAKELMS